MLGDRIRQYDQVQPNRRSYILSSTVQLNSAAPPGVSISNVRSAARLFWQQLDGRFVVPHAGGLLFIDPIELRGRRDADAAAGGRYTCRGPTQRRKSALFPCLLWNYLQRYL